ncbi:hypothetical protein [Bacteroides congonensis]|uniref:hypothetical protein n=1 Tax=Bacteroides congonensis TaxID=1871006 RepID=UPI00189BD62F|nr:hypothetical protein [Bacteroides congonensis]
MKFHNKTNKTFRQTTTFIQRLVVNVLFGVIACLVYAGMKPENNTKPETKIISPLPTKDTTKDFIDGDEILVGINYTLTDNQVSIFTQNDLGLKYASQFYLNNPKDEKFMPKMRFIVSLTSGADPLESTAQIFISEKAALRMGISKKLLRIGVFKMKIFHNSN